MDAALADARSPFLLAELRDPKLRRWAYMAKHLLKNGALSPYAKREINRLFGVGGLPAFRWRAKLYRLEVAILERYSVFNWREKAWLNTQLELSRAINLAEHADEMTRFLTEYPFVRELNKIQTWRKPLQALVRFHQKHKRWPGPPDDTFPSVRRFVWIWGAPTGREFALCCFKSGNISEAEVQILVSLTDGLDYLPFSD